MLDVMTRAKNAIDAYDAQLRINSANIANLSVPGYKALRISFQTVFENVLNGGSAASNTVGGINPTQFGSAMAVSNTSLDFSQGSMSTGGNLDLGIQGNGLFTVSPDKGQSMLYTRAGQFSIDSDGNLVTSSGMQVYGFKGGALVPITGLNNYNTANLSWTSDGRLVVFNGTNTDGSTNFNDESNITDTGFSAALTSFSNLSGLTQAEGSTFQQSPASGAPLQSQSVGGSFGTVVPRNFEQSNVVYTDEVIDSMNAQRAMSGNLTIVRMISDEITNFINRIS